MSVNGGDPLAGRRPFLVIFSKSGPLPGERFGVFFEVSHKKADQGSFFWIRSLQFMIELAVKSFFPLIFGSLVTADSATGVNKKMIF